MVSTPQVFRIIKHCTLPFRASTGRENKFGGGNEDRKEADLTSQQADPTADLSLGTTKSEFEHIRKMEVSSVIGFPSHADIQVYFCHLMTIIMFPLVVFPASIHTLQ